MFKTKVPHDGLSKKIPLEMLPNTRDLGGMAGADGRKIRPGLLIRSGNLEKASPEDLRQLGEKVSLVIDLRSYQEVEEHPDAVIPGAKYLHLPVIAEITPGITKEDETKTFDEKTRDLVRSARRSRAFMIKTYSDMADSDFALQKYVKFVDCLLENEGGAVLWHCTAGKDRAGFAALIIQKILGIPDDVIFRDYMFTNENMAGEIRAMVKNFRSQGGWMIPNLKKSVQYLFGAWPEFLEALLLRIDERWGSFDGFLEKGLGITEEKKILLREKYLE